MGGIAAQGGFSGPEQALPPRRVELRPGVWITSGRAAVPKMTFAAPASNQSSAVATSRMPPPTCTGTSTAFPSTTA